MEGIKELERMLEVINKYKNEISHTLDKGGQIILKQNKNKDIQIYQNLVKKIN